MTREDLDAEILSLALALEDEFGWDDETVSTISELLHISHTRVREVLVPEVVGG